MAKTAVMVRVLKADSIDSDQINAWKGYGCNGHVELHEERMRVLLTCSEYILGRQKSGRSVYVAVSTRGYEAIGLIDSQNSQLELAATAPWNIEGEPEAVKGAIGVILYAVGMPNVVPNSKRLPRLVRWLLSCLNTWYKYKRRKYLITSPR